MVPVPHILVLSLVLWVPLGIASGREVNSTESSVRHTAGSDAVAQCKAPILIQGKSADIPAAVHHYHLFSRCLIVATEVFTLSCVLGLCPPKRNR